MVARSIFASYYRLLVGAGIAFLALSLVGCNEIAAQKADPGRPVLVATVHYAPESPARSFVGTIRPR
ncbi:MAG TPA: efflux RND transporter periplasmic adaptor subunit, partial [Bradyrhizobium sp.]|nr:efflux RND transporter periplasmic adaptor subunit [Bradyrhizobium sp.]